MKKSMSLSLLSSLLLLVFLCSSAFAQDVAPAQEERLSVTTGLPTSKAYTPFLVQVDNAGGARPQAGFSHADIIYECEIQNGGATRYTLLFNDQMPEMVAPVRSARLMHADIALDWNATLIHWGGQQKNGTNVYDYMKKHNVSHIDGIGVGRPLFTRSSKRAAPHNVVLAMADLTSDAEFAREAEAKGPLTFSADAYTRKGIDVQTFEITYAKGYAPGYSFNPEDGLYYRFYKREPHLDANTREQVAVTNVIIMTADYEYYNWESDRPVAHLTGKNHCKYFIDGKYIEGYWTRESIDSTTYFRDTDGEEVIFKPGRTAIQVVREDKEIEMY